MFEARYIKKNSEGHKSANAAASADEVMIISRIKPGEYDAQIHKGNLLCAGFNCAAKVYYRPGVTTQGEIKNRVAHFATMPKQEHHAECDIEIQETQNRAWQSLQDAIKEGRKVLIHLNIDLGMPLGDRFSQASKEYQKETAYGRFTEKNDYLAYSVSNLEGFMNAYNIIALQGDEAMDKAFVAHCYEVRRLKNVVIGSDKAKLKTLFNDMAQKKGLLLETSMGKAVGFPRVITFKPTARTLAQQEMRSCLNGTAQLMGEKYKYLLHNVSYVGDRMHSDLTSYEEVQILAMPNIDLKAIGKIENKDAFFETASEYYSYKKAKKPKFYVLNWDLRNQNQYRVIGEPIPKQIALF
jgi:hypothetical protein